jgi:transposase InsO family protein
VPQQLREATPCDERPRFDRLAVASGIRALRTPVRAPRANATCERCLGSVRRECLDHALIVGERHLRRVLKAYAAYFSRVLQWCPAAPRD